MFWFRQPLRKHFLLLLVVEAFSLQKVVQMLEEVVVGWREVKWIWQMSQNFIALLVQLLNCWLCNIQMSIVVEKNWASLLTNASWRCCSFQCISSICWAYFSDVMVFLGFRKLDSRSHGQQTTRQWPWPYFVFGKCFEGSYQSKHWAGPLWLSYRIHFSLHITIQLRNALLLCRVREDDASKQWFFFSASTWGIHLSSFSTFPICFKGWTSVEWLTLTSSGTSHVIVRGSASMTLSIGCCQLPMASHCTPHLQGSCLLCKTSLTTTALYIC